MARSAVVPFAFPCTPSLLEIMALRRMGRGIAERFDARPGERMEREFRVQPTRGVEATNNPVRWVSGLYFHATQINLE